MAFDLFSLHLDGYLLLRPVGEIDFSVRERLDDVLPQVGAVAPEIVFVDLAELAFMDSTGAAWLARLQRRAAAAGGRVELLNVPGAARRVLRVCGPLQLLSAPEAA